MFGFTVIELNQIVVNALTFQERIHLAKSDDAQPITKSQLLERRLEKFYDVLSEGDNLANKMLKFTELSDLTQDDIESGFHDYSIKRSYKLPDWAICLQKLFIYLDQFSSSSNATQVRTNEQIFNEKDSMPFEELYTIIVHFSQTVLQSKLGPLFSHLSPKAQQILQHHLLSRLSDICSRTLQLQFSVFRLQKASTNPLHQQLDQIGYKEFIDSLFDEGFKNIVIEYPVLGRFVALEIIHWTESIKLMLERLAKDSARLSNILNNGEALGKIKSLSPGLSDFHNCGQSVIKLSFNKDLKIIYKPRSVELEHFFFKSLEELNKYYEYPYKVLKVVPSDGYGWMEYVDHHPCTNKQQTTNYFNRAGALLCLLYVLGANDGHAGNVIACGDQPILVDAETMFHPEYHAEDDGSDEDASTIASKQLRDSVLRTGLLPIWHFGSLGEAYETSGLGGEKRQETPFEREVWRDINTEKMVMYYSPANTFPRKNLPHFNGRTMPLDEYEDEISSGFKRMYELLLRNDKSILVGKHGILNRCNIKWTRFIFRPTQTYATLIYSMTHPAKLRSGIEISIQLITLYGRLFSIIDLDKDILNTYVKIIEEEIRNLVNLDVPYFLANIDKPYLKLRNDSWQPKPYDGFLTKSSYETVLQRVDKLSVADLAFQLKIISNSLRAKQAIPHNDVIEDSKNKKDYWSEDSKQNDNYIFQKAKEIASQIIFNAIESSNDTSLAWISLQHKPLHSRFQLEVVDHSLYGGSGGIALFFSALFAFTGDSTYREFALRTLLTLRKNTESSDTLAKFSGKIGIGGATGLGSSIYVLLKCGLLLEEPKLIENAISISNSISLESINSDSRLDIISGTAGLLLSLLSLNNECNSNKILSKAIMCGDKLLASMVSDERGYEAWKNIHKVMQTGFSHGAAGISFSLFQLYNVTGTETYLEAALKGLNYENSLYSEKNANWPRVMKDGSQTQLVDAVSWCYGAAGIGLSRLGMSKSVNSSLINNDIEKSIQKILSYPSIGGVDHLCCGNAGRIEFLLYAGSKLKRPALVKEAKKRMKLVISFAEKSGGYALFTKLPRGTYSPSLFQGTAGIGYQILRCSDPFKIPAILLWE